MMNLDQALRSNRGIGPGFHLLRHLLSSFILAHHGRVVVFGVHFDDTYAKGVALTREAAAHLSWGHFAMSCSGEDCSPSSEYFLRSAASQCFEPKMEFTIGLVYASCERVFAVIENRNRPQKHVQRARIILLSADRRPVLEVAARSGASRPSVWLWQQRFAEEGVDGLLRDKTRKPVKTTLPAATIARMLALPCGEPPRPATHWTGRAVAGAVGVSLSAVQRIWQAHRLQPHRVRTFKKSNDPAFAAKVEDVVGLYMNPPPRAVVVSIDEKSQIQALDRTQPGAATAFRAFSR